MEKSLVYLILSLLNLCFLSNGYLNVLNVDHIPVERNVTIAQLFLFNDPPVEFDEVRDVFVLYDLMNGVDLNYTDRLVFVHDDYLYSQVEEIMNCGAKMIVFASAFQGGYLSLQVKDLALRKGYTNIAFQIWLKDEGIREMMDMIVDGYEVEVIITNENNVNEWEEQSEVWIWWALQIFCCVFASFVALFALEKFVFKMMTKKYEKKGKGFNASDAILLIEAIINIFRAFYAIIGPANIRPFPVLWGGWASQVTAPFSALTTLLLLIHLNDAIKCLTDFISNYRIIFYVLFSVLIVLGAFVLPILFWIIPDVVVMLYLVLGFYFVVSLLIAIYIFYTTPRMFKFVEMMDEGENRNTLNRMARLLIISGGITIIWCGFTLYSFITKGTPTEWFLLNFLWLLILILVSLLQVLVFEPESKYYKLKKKQCSTKGTQEKSKLSSQQLSTY